MYVISCVQDSESISTAGIKPGQGLVSGICLVGEMVKIPWCNGGGAAARHKVFVEARV